MTLIAKVLWALVLFVLFLWDLLRSSVQVAVAVLSPGNRTEPRLLTIPLKASSPVEVTLVGNFISLTPGTLTVDVSEDGRTLLVHDLFAGDSSDGTRADVASGIETRVLRVTR